MSEQQPQSEAELNTAATSPGGIRLGAVFGTVLAAMVVLGLGFLGYEYWSNRVPTYMKVTGRVMWDGKPVTIGAVLTRHARYPREGAIGGLDSDGKFDLMTNGKDGAVLGTHKIIVASYGMGMGTTPLVPARYLKVETTPLSIEVTDDPSKNHFELEVIGEKQLNRERGPRGGDQPAAESAGEPEAAAGSGDSSSPSESNPSAPASDSNVRENSDGPTEKAASSEAAPEKSNE